MVAAELQRYNIDIAALSETRISDEGSLTEVGGGCTFVWKGRPTGYPRIHGVGFAVRSSLLPSLTESPVGISERLMSMPIPLTRGRFATLLSAYAPTLDSSDEEKTLSMLHCVPHSSMYLVLISCFYSAISMHGLALITKSVIGRHGVGKSNNNALRLLEVCSEFSLCMTNTMFQLQNKFKTSWMHPRSKHWHLIDFVIVRRSDLRDVKITRSLRGADCWTDHRRIRSQLSMHVRPASRMKQPCKRLNTNALLTEEVRGNFQRTLNLQWEELSNPSEGPADATTLAAEWESITDMILSATMKSTLGVMRKRHQDWFDANRKEIHVILYEKNSAYKAHLQQPKSAAHYQRWIRIRSQVQHHLREMRNSWWMTKAHEIQEHANNSNIRAFYEATL